MSKISLRWRITILMGVLVFCASVLLTALSIHNAENNFVIPLTRLSNYTDIIDRPVGTQDSVAYSLESITSDLPDNIYYTQEISPEINHAQQAFSLSGFLYMGLITVASMVAAYYLAGNAMCPISKLNNEIKQIDGNTLSKRVPVPPTKDEIENLSLSFNQLLERLEQEFEREKQFSANAAHELKTPLATIITSAQVLNLSAKPTPEEYQENLETTLQSARRLSEVVDGLLFLYQTDREHSFCTIDLSQLFHDIQQEIAPLYSEKNITIRYDINAHQLTGNSLLLYRAFFNLIENACKYTEPNGEVTVSSYCQDHKILVRISDTGIGISDEDINHIFEPFYRADKSRSRKISGAGLGLSIAKEIFKLHNADITIQSTPNNGTMVHILLLSSINKPFVH